MIEMLEALDHFVCMFEAYTITFKTDFLIKSQVPQLKERKKEISPSENANF